MASDIQIVQKPVNTADNVPVITNWTPAIGYMIYQDDATTASYFYYKLILEVRLDDASGLLLGKIVSPIRLFHNVFDCFFSIFCAFMNDDNTFIVSIF